MDDHGLRVAVVVCASYAVQEVEKRAGMSGHTKVGPGGVVELTHLAHFF